MIRIDDYMGREFNWRTYNCWDFVRDVWKDHTGKDIGSRDFPTIARDDIKRFEEIAFKERLTVVTERIEKPEDPCLVVFIRPNVMSHIGIWVRGRVLHLRPQGNVVYQALDEVAVGYKELRWYK